MTISPFEATSFYEFNRCKENENSVPLLKLIIFNVDNYSVGFCTCTKDGQINTVHTERLSEEIYCMDDINKAFMEATKRKSSIEDCVCPNIENFNKKMRMYYQSEKQLNSNFADALGLDLDCAGFEKIFDVALNRMGELLLELDDLWTKTKFDESESRFIIVGKAALYYPIVHCIKGFLTFDPFLPDDRFVSDVYPDRADKIISIGEQEYGKKKKSERVIYVILAKENNLSEKKQLPVPDESHDDTVKTDYLEPIFVSADDQLKIEVNSKKMLIDIPYSIAPLDCDVIGIGACMSDNKPIIRIRRYNHPARIYDIPVV